MLHPPLLLSLFLFPLCAAVVPPRANLTLHSFQLTAAHCTVTHWVVHAVYPSPPPCNGPAAVVLDCQGAHFDGLRVMNDATNPIRNPVLSMAAALFPGVPAEGVVHAGGLVDVAHRGVCPDAVAKGVAGVRSAAPGSSFGGGVLSGACTLRVGATELPGAVVPMGNSSARGVDEATAQRVLRSYVGPTAFVETSVPSPATGVLPGLMDLVKPIAESVITPVTDIIGSVRLAGEAGVSVDFHPQVLSALLGDMMDTLVGKKLNEALTKEVLLSLTHAVVPAVAETMVDPTVAMVTDQVTHALPVQMRKRITELVVPKVAKTITDTVTEALKETVPEALDTSLPTTVADRLTITLSHILTRSVTQSVVPAVTIARFASPEQAHFCQLCFHHSQYCEACHFAPQQLVQAVYYAQYYAHFYGNYYARALTPSETEKLAHQLT